MYHVTTPEGAVAVVHDAFRPKFSSKSKAALYFQTVDPKYLYKWHKSDVIIPPSRQIDDDVWVAPYKQKLSRDKQREKPICLEVDVEECDEAEVELWQSLTHTSSSSQSQCQAPPW